MFLFSVTLAHLFQDMLVIQSKIILRLLRNFESFEKKKIILHVVTLNVHIQRLFFFLIATLPLQWRTIIFKPLLCYDKKKATLYFKY